jgi:hypothetical protein
VLPVVAFHAEPNTMSDLLVIVISLGFGGLTWLLLELSDRLLGDKK